MFELQPWSEAHWEGFASMQSEPAVMADLGGPFNEAASREKFERYRNAWRTEGSLAGRSSMGPGSSSATRGSWRGMIRGPLGRHHEIGWRFRRAAWGRGIATASARRALRHAWSVIDAREVVSYTAADNLRSQGVMRRLDLRRVPDRDFTARYPRGEWSGLTWVADRPIAETGER